MLISHLFYILLLIKKVEIVYCAMLIHHTEFRWHDDIEEEEEKKIIKWFHGNISRDIKMKNQQKLTSATTIQTRNKKKKKLKAKINNV